MPIHDYVYHGPSVRIGSIGTYMGSQQTTPPYTCRGRPEWVQKHLIIAVLCFDTSSRSALQTRLMPRMRPPSGDKRSAKDRYPRAAWPAPSPSPLPFRVDDTYTSPRKVRSSPTRKRVSLAYPPCWTATLTQLKLDRLSSRPCAPPEADHSGRLWSLLHQLRSATDRNTATP